MKTLNESNIKVLLIEDNPGDVIIIKELLKEVKEFSFKLKIASRLLTGLKYLEMKEVDVILLDLMLPDSLGLETLNRINKYKPQLPIVVITGLSDKTLAIEAVRKGAQDYLVKEEVSRGMLVRSIMFSIERQQFQKDIEEKANMDFLTGIYNRRGFETLAKRQIEIANRQMKKFYLIYIDVDNMKYINDNYGHLVGDNVLINTAKILNDTFRKSDIIARIGGDEFAVIIEEEIVSVNSIINRLEEKLREYNTKKNFPFELSLSIGKSIFEPQDPSSFEELLVRADKMMYKNKKCKKSQYKNC